MWLWKCPVTEGSKRSDANGWRQVTNTEENHDEEISILTCFSNWFARA
jgi:hypothetical protein